MTSYPSPLRRPIRIEELVLVYPNRGCVVGTAIDVLEEDTRGGDELDEERIAPGGASSDFELSSICAKAERTLGGGLSHSGMGEPSSSTHSHSPSSSSSLVAVSASDGVDVGPAEVVAGSGAGALFTTELVPVISLKKLGAAVEVAWSEAEVSLGAVICSVVGVSGGGLSSDHSTAGCSSWGCSAVGCSSASTAASSV
jgi:hypothetical protein